MAWALRLPLYCQSSPLGLPRLLLQDHYFQSVLHALPCSQPPCPGAQGLQSQVAGFSQWSDALPSGALLKKE